jgi:hypothetical protein
MKRVYPRTVVQNPLTVLRKAGYAPFRDPQTGEESFVIRLTKEFYPRFHLYVEENASGVSFNLHLDQKKPSYGDNHAHAGEYEGSTVEKEMERIEGWVAAVHRESIGAMQRPKTAPAPEKKSWLSKLFG